MKKLSDTFSIGKLEIKNRICLPPMVCFSWSDERGYVSQKHLDHYSALASGGFGLIIVEATCVNPSGRLSLDQLGLWDDSHIEGHRKITDSAHQRGIPVLLQIHHSGVVSVCDNLACPSPYSYENSKGEVRSAKGLTIDEVLDIKEQFVSACVRAYKAGYDGVELHGCHNYLISQFMNKQVNKRSDKYATPWLFAEEILQQVKGCTSCDFVVGIRLGVFEPTLEDAIENAVNLEKAGIDFLNMSYGFARESQPFAPGDFPYKDVIWGAGQVKSRVNIPVFAVNSIRTPQEAQDVLALTDVDMVCIGRSSLVDYSWASHALNNEPCGKCLWCPSCAWRNDPSKCPGRRVAGV